MNNSTDKLVIDDVIYGKITIPSDIAAIIETPLFQRLKSIKQLGFLDFKDNNKHNRYNHSVGSYHAATRLLNALEENTKRFRTNKIPEIYRKSVQIAALLHDVGQGPFSNTWQYIVPSYKHVDQTIWCVKAIFKELDDKLFPELRQDFEFGIRLIEALIKGSISTKSDLKVSKKFRFIFDIFNHKFNIYKWDYLKRDNYYLKELGDKDLKNIDKIFLRAKIANRHIEHYEHKSYVFKYHRTIFKFREVFYQSPQSSISRHIFKLALEEIKPKINNIQCTTIYGKHSLHDFLQLTDENLLKLIENSYYAQFLQPNIKFEKVDNLPDGVTNQIVGKKKVEKKNPNTKTISYTEEFPNPPNACMFPYSNSLQIRQKSNRNKVETSWSHENILKLIQEVESRPSLWDVGCAEYKRHKGHVWQEVATAIPANLNDCKWKWNNLRNTYNSNFNKLQKKKSGQGTDEEIQIVWIYFKPMMFFEKNKLRQSSQSTSSLECGNANDSVSSDVMSSLSPSLPAHDRKRKSNTPPSLLSTNNRRNELKEMTVDAQQSMNSRQLQAKDSSTINKLRQSTQSTSSVEYGNTNDSVSSDIEFSDEMSSLSPSKPAYDRKRNINTPPSLLSTNNRRNELKEMTVDAQQSMNSRQLQAKDSSTINKLRQSTQSTSSVECGNTNDSVSSDIEFSDEMSSLSPSLPAQDRKRKSNTPPSLLSTNNRRNELKEMTVDAQQSMNSRQLQAKDSSTINKLRQSTQSTSSLECGSTNDSVSSGIGFSNEMSSLSPSKPAYDRKRKSNTPPSLLSTNNRRNELKEMTVDAQQSMNSRQLQAKDSSTINKLRQSTQSTSSLECGNTNDSVSSGIGFSNEMSSLSPSLPAQDRKRKSNTPPSLLSTNNRRNELKEMTVDAQQSMNSRQLQAKDSSTINKLRQSTQSTSSLECGNTNDSVSSGIGFSNEMSSLSPSKPAYDRKRKSNTPPSLLSTNNRRNELKEMTVDAQQSMNSRQLQAKDSSTINKLRQSTQSTSSLECGNTNDSVSSGIGFSNEMSSLSPSLPAQDRKRKSNTPPSLLSTNNRRNELKEMTVDAQQSMNSRQLQAKDSSTINKLRQSTQSTSSLECGNTNDSVSSGIGFSNEMSSLSPSLPAQDRKRKSNTPPSLLSTNNRRNELKEMTVDAQQSMNSRQLQAKDSSTINKLRQSTQSTSSLECGNTNDSVSSGIGFSNEMSSLSPSKPAYDRKRKSNTPPSLLSTNNRRNELKEMTVDAQQSMNSRQLQAKDSSTINKLRQSTQSTSSLECGNTNDSVSSGIGFSNEMSSLSPSKPAYDRKRKSNTPPSLLSTNNRRNELKEMTVDAQQSMNSRQLQAKDSSTINKLRQSTQSTSSLECGNTNDSVSSGIGFSNEMSSLSPSKPAYDRKRKSNTPPSLLSTNNRRNELKEMTVDAQQSMNSRQLQAKDSSTINKLRQSTQSTSSLECGNTNDSVSSGIGFSNEMSSLSPSLPAQDRKRKSSTPLSLVSNEFNESRQLQAKDSSTALGEYIAAELRSLTPEHAKYARSELGRAFNEIMKKIDLMVPHQQQRENM